MVKVKLKVARSGPTLSQAAGDEIEVSEAEAERLVAANQAELARSKAPERAVKRTKAEKAVK